MENNTFSLPTGDSASNPQVANTTNLQPVSSAPIAPIQPNTAAPTAIVQPAIQPPAQTTAQPAIQPAIQAIAQPAAQQTINPEQMDVESILQADLSQLHLNPQLAKEVNSVKHLSFLQIVLASLFVLTLSALGVVYGWSQGWIFQGSLSGITTSDQVYTRTFPSEQQSTPDNAPKKEAVETEATENKPTAATEKTEGANPNASSATTTPAKTVTSDQTENKTDVSKTKVKAPKVKSTSNITSQSLSTASAMDLASKLKLIKSTLSPELISGVNKLDALQIVSDTFISNGASKLRLNAALLTPELVAEPLLQRYLLALSFGVESKLISLEEAINWQQLKESKFDGTIFIDAFDQIPQETIQSWFE